MNVSEIHWHIDISFGMSPGLRVKLELKSGALTTLSEFHRQYEYYNMAEILSGHTIVSAWTTTAHVIVSYLNDGHVARLYNLLSELDHVARISGPRFYPAEVRQVESTRVESTFVR